MKVLIVLCLALAASASVVREHNGWRRSIVRDLSKFKPRDLLVPVTPNPHASVQSLIQRLVAKARPEIPKLPHTKSFADVCGIEGTGISSHIVGGSQAKPHQYPWQVGLFLDGMYFCGGSIISDEWILTAAHCADGISEFVVVIGAHEVRNPAEEGHLETTSKTAYIHPEWDSFNLKNDIALVKVSKITFNKFVSPICLPERSDVGNDFSDVSMTVSGWGRESDSASGIAKFLNTVTRPVITNEVCNSYYGIIGKGIICIDTKGGKGTCNGDSGGPLSLPHGGEARRQYGVVSFGSTLGCESGYPAGFTRVTEYLDFIADTTGIIIA